MGEVRATGGQAPADIAEQAQRATLHVVNPEDGAHQTLYTAQLGVLSLRAVMQEKVFNPYTQTVHDSLHDVSNLAWFESYDKKPTSYETQAQNTFLVDRARPFGPNKYSLVSAADILERQELSEYIISWLRPFIIADRASPPMPARRTDVIRDITRLLPPLSRKEYARNAIAQMPSLAEHYQTWDIDVS